MHYHSEHNWTQPYRTHGLLWEAIETLSMCETIEQQDDIADTVLADSMLTSIGIKLNKD